MITMACFALMRMRLMAPTSEVHPIPVSFLPHCFFSCKKKKKKLVGRKRKHNYFTAVLILLYQQDLIETYCFDKVFVFPSCFMVSYDY